MRAYSEGGDVEAKKVESLEENLMEKEENLEHHDCLNQALLIKVGQSNDVLLDARKELINVSLSLVAYYFSNNYHYY